ncbi:MAG: hypothetical protein CMP11_01580 [Zetaproteobacteria bacterium]|nr:hypothetical protein [Pseudobdellovibrionaceae bacterium]
MEFISVLSALFRNGDTMIPGSTVVHGGKGCTGIHNVVTCNVVYYRMNISIFISGLSFLFQTLFFTHMFRGIGTIFVFLVFALFSWRENVIGFFTHGTMLYI